MAGTIKQMDPWGLWLAFLISRVEIIFLHFSSSDTVLGKKKKKINKQLIGMSR
jgi:hypothetical protein